MVNTLLKNLRSVDKNLPVYISSYYWSHPLNSVKTEGDSVVLSTNNRHIPVFNVRHLAQTLLNLDKTYPNLYMCEIRPYQVFNDNFPKNIGYSTKYYKFIGMTVYRDSIILSFSDDY